MTKLDDRLLAAHTRGDKTGLVMLYAQAADQAKDLDAACFFLTQAYVFALEVDHPALPDLQSRLKAHNRI